MTPTGMTTEIATKLRAPFDPATIGKLPRITCGACRDSRTKNCDRHQKMKCRDCNNWITTAHLHLDYVGHAETTDRLLQVDPAWTWEPVAFDTNGLPLLDADRGLWIRLTVAGVTRLGYGSADGKRGPDAVKEAIGDAIRNAAMRFGVAIDLWGAKFKEPDDTDQPATEPEPAYSPPVGRHPEMDMPAVTEKQHKRMAVLWRDLGFAGEANRPARIDVTSKLVKRQITSSAQLSEDEANVVIASLQARLAEVRGQNQQNGAAA